MTGKISSLCDPLEWRFWASHIPHTQIWPPSHGFALLVRQLSGLAGVLCLHWINKIVLSHCMNFRRHFCHIWCLFKNISAFQKFDFFTHDFPHIHSKYLQNCVETFHKADQRIYFFTLGLVDWCELSVDLRLRFVVWSEGRIVSNLTDHIDMLCGIDTLLPSWAWSDSADHVNIT